MELTHDEVLVKIGGCGRFAKFANQCKDAALNLLGHHAKNKKHSRNIPDQKLTLPSD